MIVDTRHPTLFRFFRNIQHFLVSMLCTVPGNAPEGQTFNPANWNLVAHVTTRDGNMIITQPFVASMTAGEKGILTFTQREQTVYEAMLP